VTLAGLATVPELGPAEPRGGAAPSSVAEGLNSDGLVQRRRVRKPVDFVPEKPELEKPEL